MRRRRRRRGGAKVKLGGYFIGRRYKKDALDLEIDYKYYIYIYITWYIKTKLCCPDDFYAYCCFTIYKKEDYFYLDFLCYQLQRSSP